MISDKVGETFKNNSGEVFTIIEYFNANNCTISFHDTSKTIVKNVRYRLLKTGEISNPNTPSLFGVGYIGVGVYRSSESHRLTNSYKSWRGIIQRCYSKEFQLKNPTYVGCLVSEEFHNFQTYSKFYYESCKFGQVADKDILLIGNKIYNRDLISFVPPKINSVFQNFTNINSKYPIGVSIYKGKFISSIRKGSSKIHLGTFDTPDEAFVIYKTTKENYVKEMALSEKSNLSEKTFNALMSWELKTNY